MNSALDNDDIFSKSKSIQITSLNKVNDNSIYLNHKYSFYCCAFCSKIPEIINFDEKTNKISFECQEHGMTTMNIHDYLEKMSHNLIEIFFKDKKCNECNKHNNDYYYYCKTCDKYFCEKCNNDEHLEHTIFNILNSIPNNNEISLIKNKINIFIEEKNKLLERIEILNDKIIFYDTLINTIEKQKNNYFLNINIKHLVYGEDFCINTNINNTSISKRNSLNANKTIEEYINNNLKDNLFNEDKTKLNLIDKKINDEYLHIIFNNIGNYNYSFDNIKHINLRGNNIKSLNFLTTSEFPKLEFLSLNDNNIQNIESLQKINMPLILELYLAKNNISSINVFKYMEIKKLQVLWLSENKIKDIEVLKDVNFPGLEKLALSKNLIKDINVLNYVKFPQLIELYLSDNEFDMENDENKNIIKKLEQRIEDVFY